MSSDTMRSGGEGVRAALIEYAMHYGPRCRECADHGDICPMSGMACGERRKATEFVVDALIYGATHGYCPSALAVAPSPASSPNGGECPNSPDGRHQVDTSMEEGPCNCFHCGVSMKQMVNRFLQWRLPDDFHPDAGISFTPDFNLGTAYPMRHQPRGTNLFTAAQAESMIRYLLATTPSPDASPDSGETEEVASGLDHVASALREVHVLGRDGIDDAAFDASMLGQIAACERAASLLRRPVRAAIAATSPEAPANRQEAREIERLREHIVEQVTHAETRIADGTTMGASIWRIALEDIVRESRAALTSPKDVKGDGR